MVNRFLKVLLLVSLTFGGATFSQGNEDPAAVRRPSGLIFEGTFENAAYHEMPENARRTQLVAAYRWDYGLRYFDEAQWTAEGWDWPKFHEHALQIADDLAERVKPEMIRDPRGVIEYGLIVDPDPFLTSVLLSKKFRAKFTDTLGESLHIVILDRNRIYLFPVTGGHLQDYGPSLVAEFREAPLPVSLEVFLLDEKGLRVIGELSRD